MTRYRDKPPQASDGDAFEELCCALWFAAFGERLTRCLTRAAQIAYGDTYEGVEFKELQRSFERLHIEFEEKIDTDQGWVKSGIRRPRNFYMCGFARDDQSDIYVFDPKVLLAWAEREGPPVFEHPTIRSYVLEKGDAARMWLYRFVKRGTDWRVFTKGIVGGRALTLADPTDEIDAGIARPRTSRAELKARAWVESAPRLAPMIEAPPPNPVVQGWRRAFRYDYAEPPT
jgi:hypothetical protein